jgi:hypothetical protein
LQVSLRPSKDANKWQSPINPVPFPMIARSQMSCTRLGAYFFFVKKQFDLFELL